MSGIWSRQLENRYSLRLGVDLRAWLDDQPWRGEGGAEFCRARTPEQLLDPEPGAIWAGFMLPDTLPLVGNDYGDWLCLRAAADGSVAEIVRWSHCGGDWLPYGRNLAEALLYDAACCILHPRRPEFNEPRPPAAKLFRLAEWACRWIPSEQGPIEEFWRRPPGGAAANDGEGVLDILSHARVAEFAVLHDRILDHLASQFKRLGDLQAAQDLGVPWQPDFVRWLFDTECMPGPERARLAAHFDLPEQELFAQDWDAAERAALDALSGRTDLGWAYDVAGWAAERRGDVARAVRLYLAGIRTSWFSDDTLGFRTHWFDERVGKFAAARLSDLSSQLDDQQRSDPYWQLYCDGDPAMLRERVQQFWLERARAAGSRGDHLLAYRDYYRAGWDLGIPSVPAYDELYDGMVRSATSAGAPALAALAQLHHRFLN